MTRTRGFTLLELVLGATLVLIISAVAMGVMVSVQSVQRDAQAKSVLTRDAQFVLDTITRDLQYLGNGVPRGRERYLSGNPLSLLRPPIRIARPDYIAFVGDLPFPNADVNGAAMLQNVGNPNDPVRPDGGGTRHRLHVSSELALCTPPDSQPTTGAYTCQTGRHRLVDVGSTTNCDASNALTAPTCPWSLGKWQGTTPGAMFPFTIVISTPTGAWVRRRVENFRTDFRDAVALHLDHGYPSDSSPGFGEQADLDALDFNQRRSGASLIAHIDRVFYSLEQLDGTPCGANSNCVLRRRQCWGWDNGLDPEDADFPDVGAAPILSSDGLGDISSCTPPGEGTGWEPIMHGIESLSLRYFATADPDVEVSTASFNEDASESVMFVQIDIELARTMPGATPGTNTTLRQTFTKRVFLENGGGAFVDDNNPRLPPGVTLPGPPGTNDVSAANGGCQTPLTCGRP